MRIALNTQEQQILASDKVRGAYTCLECNTDVVLHAGNVYAPHYKHKALSGCSYSEKADTANSMSAFHREIQEAFYKAGAELEKRYPSNRADAFYKGYVYEIQNSPIRYDTVLARNSVYGKVRWIVNAETLTVDKFDTNRLVFMVNNTIKKIRLHYKNLIIFYVFKDYDELVRIVSDNKKLAERIAKAEKEQAEYEVRKEREIEARRIAQAAADEARRELEEQKRIEQDKRNGIAIEYERLREAERKKIAEAQQLEWENNRKERESKAELEMKEREAKEEMMYQSFLDDCDNPIRKVYLTPYEAYKMKLLNETYKYLQN